MVVNTRRCRRAWANRAARRGPQKLEGIGYIAAGGARGRSGCVAARSGGNASCCGNCAVGVVPLSDTTMRSPCASANSGTLEVQNTQGLGATVPGWGIAGNGVTAAFHPSRLQMPGTAVAVALPTNAWLMTGQATANSTVTSTYAAIRWKARRENMGLMIPVSATPAYLGGLIRFRFTLARMPCSKLFLCVLEGASSTLS